jgi:hypothetical protein
MWNKKPLQEGDAQFVLNKDDLVTLRPGRETAWLDNAVERILKLFPRAPVQRIFCSKVGHGMENAFLPPLMRIYRKLLGRLMTQIYVTSRNLV